MFVGRYDNGSGYFEWAGQPVNSFKEAQAQLSDLTWADVDIVELDKNKQETIIASAPLGRGWIPTKAWKDQHTCGFCGNVNLDENASPSWEKDMGHDACNDPYCGAI